MYVPIVNAMTNAESVTDASVNLQSNLGDPAGNPYIIVDSSTGTTINVVGDEQSTSKDERNERIRETMDEYIKRQKADLNSFEMAEQFKKDQAQIDKMWSDKGINLSSLPRAEFNSGKTLLGTEATIDVPLNLCFGETPLNVKDLLMRETYLGEYKSNPDKGVIIRPNAAYDKEYPAYDFQKYFERYYRYKRGGFRIRIIPENYCQIMAVLTPLPREDSRTKILTTGVVTTDLLKKESLNGAMMTPFIGTALSNYSFRIPSMTNRPYMYTMPIQTGDNYEDDVCLKFCVLAADNVTKEINCKIFSSAADDFMYRGPVGAPMTYYTMTSDSLQQLDFIKSIPSQVVA